MQSSNKLCQLNIVTNHNGLGDEYLIGLYLYMLVVETFSGDNLKFNMYALIGWGKWYFHLMLLPKLQFYSFET